MRLLLNVCILFAVAILSSCSNSKEEKIYQTLNSGLIASYKLINQQNKIILAQLESKLSGGATVEKGKIWYPKAVAIKEASDALIGYIEKMKNKPIEGALYDSLAAYKQYVLAIDPLIKTEFSNKILLTDSAVNYQNEELDGVSANAILNYFQNNVDMTANKLIAFCNEQVVDSSFYFTVYYAIVSQNSKYVKPGDEVEILAGLGAFTKRNNPIVRIAGKEMPLNEDATGHYKFPAPKQIGKHQIPVVIEYSDQDGKRQTIYKTVEYTVMK